MTVKLAILKSGENIISDVKEGFYEERLVCYIFENPCSVKINGSYAINGNNQHSISLNRWPLLSKDNVLEIVPEWIVTLTEPADQLRELYENDVLGNQNEEHKNHSIDEQSDSGESD
jgi:hypothetical protein